MSAEAVIKDTGELYTRLFNHKPVVHGEITFFLNEFEEKRNDREVEQLFQLLEKVTEIRETQLDRVKATMDANMSNLTAKMDVAIQMCNMIAEKEQRSQSYDPLMERREARVQEWNFFIDDMEDKTAKVDKAFDDKERQLKEYYDELEQKLHIIHKQEK